jgi:hypothetical protein
VVDGGDYGILPDRLAGRKGNPKRHVDDTQRKLPKQGHGASGKPQKNTKQKKAKMGAGARGKARPAGTAGGLTIPEMIARSQDRVSQIKSDIRKLEGKLVTLREQLVLAERDLQKAKDTPRRSTLGQALHDAQKSGTPHT